MQRWVDAPGAKTLGSLVELFEEKSFAMLFVVLLGVPALPLPTGGVTHVLEIIAMLLSAAAFLAPPFTGLDTLPSLGGVLIALAVLVQDIALVTVGLLIGVAGIALEIVLGRAAIAGISSLL